METRGLGRGPSEPKSQCRGGGVNLLKESRPLLLLFLILLLSHEVSGFPHREIFPSPSRRLEEWACLTMD